MQDAHTAGLVIVRHAVDADYEDLCPLLAALDAVRRIARADLMRTADGLPRTRDLVGALIAGPDSAILVAESTERLVGFAVLLLRQNSGLPGAGLRRVAVVEHLFVDEAHRRAGVGRALLARARAWGLARHAGAVEIAVHELDQDAIRFFEAMGCEPSPLRLQARIA